MPGSVCVVKALLRHNAWVSNVLTRAPLMNDNFGKYVFIACFVGFVFLAWRAWQIKQASPTWPHVMGEMLVSKVVANNETGDQQGTSNHEWTCEVRYSYAVNGVHLTGKRLRAFGARHFTQQLAETELAPFPIGKQIKVFYDPADPTSSVLIPG